MRYHTEQERQNEHDFLIRHGYKRVSEGTYFDGKHFTRYENENRYTVNLVEA